VAQQKSEKVIQQELRQPDAFQEVGWKAQDWIVKHQSTLLSVLGLLMVGGLVAGLVNWWSERTERQAAKDLGAALAVLDRPVLEGNVTAQPMDGSKPPFKSQQEKDEALVKSLAEFRQSHGGTEASATAALPLAKAEYRLGQYDAALTHFGDFLKQAAQSEPLRVAALEGQGYAYEAQGKLAEAQQAFQQMAKAEAGGYLAGMGQYHEARMLILQGKKEEAAKLLSELPEKHPNTAAARQATERLALLATEGVRPPAKAAPAAQQDTPAAAPQEAK
jgi:tetratricopeptide (TPR) repeat protein